MHIQAAHTHLWCDQVSNPRGQDCWYLLKPQFTWLSTVTPLVHTLSCTPLGTSTPPHPQTSHPSTVGSGGLLVGVRTCPSFSYTGNDQWNGGAAWTGGWARSEGFLKAGAKVKWIGRGRRIIKRNLGKTGSGDKWREAAGRKMEQQAEGQMKRGKQRLVGWGQGEKTPLCAWVAPSWLLAIQLKLTSMGRPLNSSFTSSSGARLFKFSLPLKSAFPSSLKYSALLKGHFWGF